MCLSVLVGLTIVCWIQSSASALGLSGIFYMQRVIGGLKITFKNNNVIKDYGFNTSK